MRRETLGLDEINSIVSELVYGQVADQALQSQWHWKKWMTYSLLN
jgi:hypothetical protein